jgi:hypothetical protein
MPLVSGDPGDTPERPAGRIRNTRTLLTTAASIMSVLLLTSSFVTTLLIPPAEFQEGGGAYGRALAYLAHTYLGDMFGTLYDLSTITILWFAGASAMAGLLNIVPRYLPRYGMAPDWARARRPLVLIFTTVCFLVTVLFRADVESQAGAYATGVLALMTSATIAVTLSAWRQRQISALLGFGLIALIFVYTTGVTIVERPEGLHIALLFIVAIVITSIVSRVWRLTELRVSEIELNDLARRWINEAARSPGAIRIIAHDTDDRFPRQYAEKEREQRTCNHIPEEDPALFLEVAVRDPSEFAAKMRVRGIQIGKYRVMRAEGTTVPNSIAAFLLFVRDVTGKVPHCYFSWSEAKPMTQLFRYLLFGEGDVAPVTHEVLRAAEPDPTRRPACHVA